MMKTILLQSIKMTWRDLRAGELFFIMTALIVAIGALSATNFFVDRMQTALTSNSHQLIGADLVIRADQPLHTAWEEEAKKRHLDTARTAVFPSMAIAGSGDQSRGHLSALKAVSAGYPLRGQLRLGVERTGSSAASQSGTLVPVGREPDPGTVWVDASLLRALHLKLGDSLTLGDKSFTITRLITLEPDRDSGFISFAPRVMLSYQDLAATALIQDGSRVTYRLLVVGPPQQIDSYQTWLSQRLQRNPVKGVHIENADEGRPELQTTLRRAQQFLSLVSVLAAMLAAIAIAMASRRYMVRHLDSCAMLRCLGMTQWQLTWTHLIEFLAVAITGSLIGVALGFAGHQLLVHLLASLIQTELPSPGWKPVWQGLASGILLLTGFILPPVLQLRNVSHNRVMRRDSIPPRLSAWLVYGLGGVIFVGLLVWQTGDAELGLIAAAGFLACAVVFGLIAWGLLWLSGGLRRRVSPGALSFALQALSRRRAAGTVQIVALSLGLMALLMLTVVRGQLISQWQQSIPADAPNRFVINIQDEQRDAIRSVVTSVGMTAPALYPMIRGRLVAVNGHPVVAASYPEGRARNLVEREFNLSAVSDLPASNQIASGEWFRPGTTAPELSVEQGIATTLGLHLGDLLDFDMAGQHYVAPITSLRKLDWSSMRVNFFVIMKPQTASNLPTTWITAFQVADSQTAIDQRLAENFPNLTVIDVGNILSQIQTIVSQVSQAIEFLFLFALAAGLLVLYAAVVSTQQERMQEAGLLRALGAGRGLLQRAQWLEFCGIGLISGLLAAVGAEITGRILAGQVFHFGWEFSPGLLLIGAPAGMLCTVLGSALALRSILHRPPALTLREAS